MADGGTCLENQSGCMAGLKTDDDCVFCRYLGPEEFEFVQINRYLADTVFTQATNHLSARLFYGAD